MEKTALAVDEKKVMRLAAGGLLTGVSAAAILNLLRTAREGRDQLVAAGKTPQTDENTIVLTLPPKLAEDLGVKELAVAKPATVQTSVSTSKSALTSTPKVSGDVRNRENGQFAKLAGDGSPTGWPTLTAGVLAALGGGTLGYALIDKLMRKHKEQQLAQQLNAAQQEYMDKLQGKMACSADVFLPYSEEDMAKFAGDGRGMLESPGFLSWPLAAAALLTILGTGGAGYITKRMLDEKAREHDTVGADMPKVNRIIFRSAPVGAPEAAKMGECLATDDDIDCIRAALAVKIAHLSGDPDTILTPEIMKEAADSSAVLKKPDAGVDELMAAVSQNPQLRKLLWEKARKDRGGILKAIPSFIGTRMAGHKVKEQGKDWADQIKKMSSSLTIPIPTMSGLVASTMGSAIAGKQQAADLAKEIAVAQEAISGEKKRQKEVDTQEQVVDIVSNDPAAAAFVASNEAKIKAIVAKMLKHKQL